MTNTIPVSNHRLFETISFLFLKYVSRSRKTLKYTMSPAAVTRSTEFTGVGSSTEKMDGDILWVSIVMFIVQFPDG